MLIREDGATGGARTKAGRATCRDSDGMDPILDLEGKLFYLEVKRLGLQVRAEQDR